MNKTGLSQLFLKISSINILTLVFLFCITAVLSFRMFVFINHYSVNILFWDQWIYYKPIITKQNLWTLFSFQLGPHRQGLGELITYGLALISGWNIRYEAFTSGVLILLASIAAIYLKKSIFGKWSLFDVCIPIILINIEQFENFIGVPNLSHSVLPLFLVITYCLAWLIRPHWLRYTSVLLINFIAIFTGFGIFLGVITPVCFGVILIDDIRKKNRWNGNISLIGLIVSILSACIFLIGYTFSPFVDCFGFSWHYTVRYPAFISVMISNFFQTDYSTNRLFAISIGLFLLILLLFILIKSFWVILNNGINSTTHSETIVFIMVGFSLLFQFDAAVGRTCLGINTGASSRYMTLVSLGFLGMYLYFCSIKHVEINMITRALMVISLLFTLLPFNQSDQNYIEKYLYEGKKNWKACYITYEDINKCDQITGFKIYGADPNSINEQQVLQLFKKEHINLYLDSPRK